MRATAFVTGGGRGIGRAVVEALAGDAWVAAADLAFPQPAGPADLEIVADVRDAASVGAAVERVAKERGGLDWLICCAGIVRDRVSWKLTDAEWADVLAVNLTGAFHAARAAAPHLRRSSCGRIVFVSSINGIRGSFGQANYAASKAGLVGMARSLARELGSRNITVNVVAPGFADTDMTAELTEERKQAIVASVPLGRTASADEVAGVVQFIAGPDAGYITGAVIPVDGGLGMGH